MIEGFVINDKISGIKTQVSDLGDVSPAELEEIARSLDHLEAWKFFEKGKFGLAFRRGRRIQEGSTPRILYVHFIEPICRPDYTPTEEERERLLTRYVTAASKEVIDEVPYPTFRLTQLYFYSSKYSIKELETFLGMS